VVVAGDFVACNLDAQFMPISGGDLEISSSELAATTVYNVIEAVIVFKSICANKVVIVWILHTKNQNAGAVDAARDRLEPNAQLQVLERAFVGDEQRESVVGLVSRGLGDNIRCGRSCWVTHNVPSLLGASPGLCAVKLRRHLPSLIGIEVVDELL